MDIKKFESSQYKGKVRELVTLAENIRGHKENPKDVSLSDVVKEKYNIDAKTFMDALGIDPSVDTISNLVTLPDVDVRWIIPEIFRNAIRLGYRKAPIWPNVIIMEEQMKGLTAITPYINMSDATPRKVNEAETIPLGDISYGSKQFKIFKVGRGIKVSDEVRQYASLNLVSIFLQDFGLKFGHAMDTLAIDTLLNGEQADGSASAPVIGIATANSKIYKDFLRIWVRMARLGRIPNVIIGGETAAIDTLNLDEFKKRVQGSPESTLILKTPVPSSASYYIHGAIPANQEIMVDPSSAMIKFNAMPLKVESERIVSNQTEATYCTVTTGFAKAFRDASLIIDSSKAFASYGFPTWLDVDSIQNVVIE